MQERILVIAAASETNRRYERIFGYLQDDVTLRKPTVELIVTLLGDTADERRQIRSEFDHDAPLVCNRLIWLRDRVNDGPSSLISKFVQMDDRIVRFISGNPGGDERLEEVTSDDEDELDADPIDFIPAQLQGFAQRIAAMSGEGGRISMPPHFLFGPPGSATRDAAMWLAQMTGHAVLRIDLQKVLQSGFAFAEMLWRVRREATLREAAVCFEHFDALLEPDDRLRLYRTELARTACRLDLPVFVLSIREWKADADERPASMVAWRMDTPNQRVRQKLWEGQLNGELSKELRRGLPDLAGTFRLTPGQIRDAVKSARQTAFQRAPQAPRLSLEDIYRACNIQTNQRLGTLARRIESCCGWGDIVLPADSLRTLKEPRGSLDDNNVALPEFCGVEWAGELHHVVRRAGDGRLSTKWLCCRDDLRVPYELQIWCPFKIGSEWIPATDWRRAASSR